MKHIFTACKLDTTRSLFEDNSMCEVSVHILRVENSFYM